MLQFRRKILSSKCDIFHFILLKSETSISSMTQCCIKLTRFSWDEISNRLNREISKITGSAIRTAEVFIYWKPTIWQTNGQFSRCQTGSHRWPSCILLEINRFLLCTLMAPVECNVHRGCKVLQVSCELYHWRCFAKWRSHRLTKMLNYELNLSRNAQVPNNKIKILSNRDNKVHN